MTKLQRNRRKTIKLSPAQIFLACILSLRPGGFLSLPWRFCLSVPGGGVGTSQLFTGEGGQARTGAGVRLKCRIFNQVVFPGGDF